jgi:HEXXH motif-containing protein
VLEAAQATGSAQAGMARSGYALLAAARQHDPAAADAVIRHPSVGGWALRAVRAMRGDRALPAAEPAGLCAVAAAAAIRAGLAADIEVPVTGGMVMLPSLGAAGAGGDRAVVRSAKANGQADVLSAGKRVQVPADPHQNAPGWSALHRLPAGPGVEFLIDDLDPYRVLGPADVAARLAADETEAWQLAFQDMWSLLQRHHQATAEEAAAVVRVLVPLSVPPHGQVSFSSAENFGAVALSPPANRRNFAVTLAHEVQHLKLAALLDVLSLTLPDDGRRFYAPWREDPRPISGLLQGAYAFLGVAGFWRRQRYLDDSSDRLQAHVEFARWRTAALRGADTLRSSELLTAAGQDFVRGVTRTLRSWQDEPVPIKAQTVARQDAERHLARWQSTHWPVPAWSPRGGV